MTSVKSRTTLLPVEELRVRSWRSVWVWFAIGATFGAFLIAVQVRHMGGNPADLLAGGMNPLGEWVENRLGAGDLNEFYEHDGHRYYAVAEDLRGREVPALMPDASYRYQRILYPLIASGLSVIDGLPLMWSMIFWSALAFGAAAAAVARMSAQMALPSLTALVVVANPSMWLGVQLLTADVLGLALFLWGFSYLASGRRRIAWPLFALACLAKEVFALAVVFVALMDWVDSKQSRRSGALALSALPAAIWGTNLRLRFGAGAIDELTPPFVGIVDGIRDWPYVGVQDLLFGALALTSLAAGLAVLRHPRHLWAWLTAPWLLVGLTTSGWIWGVGNNALRVLGPLTVFVAIALIDWRRGLATEVRRLHGTILASERTH